MAMCSRVPKFGVKDRKSADLGSKMFQFRVFSGSSVCVQFINLRIWFCSELKLSTPVSAE